MNNSSSFGFKTVKPEEKTSLVKEVFDSVASKYDIMNDLMSLGIHRLWKRFLIDQSGVRPGCSVLDVAGGTGDITKLFSKRLAPDDLLVLTDINSTMLSHGRSRLIDANVTNVRYAQTNAESLCFPDNSFDCITIAFGLRNVTDKDKALNAMYKALKPGGRLLVMDFSKIVLPVLNKLYDAYSFKLLPKLGKWIAGDEDSYRYLAESIRVHPDQETLKTMMEGAGFDQVEYTNLTGGIVALHKGFKY